MNAIDSRTIERLDLEADLGLSRDSAQVIRGQLKEAKNEVFLAMHL